MGKIWVAAVAISLVCAAANGRLGELTSAVGDGASAAVELCLSIAGPLLLWSGIMELMRASGLAGALSRMMRPILRLLFPSARRHPDVMADISANVAANLLGIGNAATPAGIRAAAGLQRLSGSSSASDALCMLVVINTASLQLIPTTVGAVRAACGAANPFDILPAVWLASAISQAAGICAVCIFSRISRREASR